MPQSLARISLHLIFSTKNRRRVFRLAKMRDGVAAYITGILKNQGCPLIRIGVVTDHIHILYSQFHLMNVMFGNEAVGPRWGRKELQLGLTGEAG